MRRESINYMHIKLASSFMTIFIAVAHSSKSIDPKNVDLKSGKPGFESGSTIYLFVHSCYSIFVG